MINKNLHLNFEGCGVMLNKSLNFENIYYFKLRAYLKLLLKKNKNTTNFKKIKI